MMNTENVNIKICNKCGVEKDISNFQKRLITRDKLDWYCKTCRREQSRDYYRKNPERFKQSAREYYYQNQEKAIEKVRDYRRRNKTKINIKQKEKYYREDQQKILKEKWKKDWIARKRKCAENFITIITQYPLILKILIKAWEYKKQQMKLVQYLRGRICTAIKSQNATKYAKSLVLIGCSIDEVRQHLESQFLPGMTWDNHGRGPGKWNIDHRIPCVAWDLSDPEQQRKCFHYKNLQPLWYDDHLTKTKQEAKLTKLKYLV